MSKEDYKKLMDEAKREKWAEEAIEAERKERMSVAEGIETASARPYDFDDEELDPYVILNEWYRKKGINIRTEFVDGRLVDVAT